MTTNNPYSTPTETSDSSPTEADPTFGAIAKSTFLAWEKLRLIYIAILIVVTLGLVAVSQPLGPSKHLELLGVVIFGGVVANVCYFLGPVIETYVTWLGFPSKMLRYGVFALGTVFASALATGTILSILS